jgi:hypothetical protein
MNRENGGSALPMDGRLPEQLGSGIKSFRGNG